MLTKEQKRNQVDNGVENIKKSHNLVFVDFSGVPVADMARLKNQLRVAGVQFKIVKKRLLDIALKRAGIDFDVLQFSAQVATAFVPGELTDAAAPLHKFGKEQEKQEHVFKVLGAYDVASKEPINAEDFVMIAKLPSREVMLGIVAGAFSGVIRAFMYGLQEIAKKGNNTNQNEVTEPVLEVKPAENEAKPEGSGETKEVEQANQ